MRHASRRSAIATMTIVLVLFTALLAVTAPNLTPAAQAASDGWPIEVNQNRHLDQIVTHPDGAVTLAGCGYGGEPSGRQDFVTYSPSGTSINGTATSRNQLDFCQPNGVAGKNGTMYGIEYMDDDRVLQLAAYAAKKRQWTLNLRSRCSGRDVPIMPHGVVAGPNGDLYVALQDECYQLSLIGVSAAGKIKFTRQLGFSQAPGGAQLIKAYLGGVVLAQNYSGSNTPTTFRHFDYTGKELANRAYVLRLQPEEQLNDWDVNYEGTVFAAPQRVDTNRPKPCNADHLTERVFRRTTTGVMTVFNLRPHCMKVRELKTTPDGGAVLLHEQERFWAEFETKPLFLLTKDGKVRPHRLSLELSTDEGLYVDGVQVGINGNILAWRYVYRSHRHPGLHVSELTLLSPGGGVLARYSTEQLWNEKEFGYVFATQGSKIAMVNGAVYAVMCQRMSVYGSCNHDTAHLHRIPFTGTSLDYPRGLIAGVKAPTTPRQLRVSAIGDSFMANLGIAPPEPSKARPNCNRSQNAYVRQLANDPTSNVALNAFVACSGATTTDVINGMEGDNPERSQLQALSKNDDVVLLSIGGNDIQFAPFARACAFPGCDEKSERYKRSQQLLKNVTRDVGGLLSAIRRRVRPDTLILVIGYPNVTPTNENNACWPLNKEEARASQKLLVGLNTSLREAAIATKSPRTGFVDLQREAAFSDRDFCSDDPYFFPPGDTWPSHSLHANEKGARIYKEVIRRKL